MFHQEPIKGWSNFRQSVSIGWIVTEQLSLVWRGSDNHQLDVLFRSDRTTGWKPALPKLQILVYQQLNFSAVCNWAPGKNSESGKMG